MCSDAAELVNESLVQSARHAVFDALLFHTAAMAPMRSQSAQRCRSGSGGGTTTTTTQSTTTATGRRQVSGLMLCLPLLTPLVMAIGELWRLARTQGHVARHRLLSEMVDRLL